MKTLIIDNYDSYTYILAHYIWEISGQRPIIIKNNAYALEELGQFQFDCIVISPGPGRPEVENDFGICDAVLRHFTQVPILGVCLGHQGLAYTRGGEIHHAPYVRHGKVSNIHHNGDGLFEGVPSPFQAVRYHSLVVSEKHLPSDLEVLATSEDDHQVMAIRHRTLRHYGVQFHPESIGTDYGRRILKNFLNTKGPKNSSVPKVTQEVQTNNIIYEKRRWADPVLVFRKLFRDKCHAFWLDSSLNNSENRFSYMGCGHEVIKVHQHQVSQLYYDEKGVLTSQKRLKGNPFRIIQQIFKNKAVVQSTAPFGFSGGLVGYLSYEFGQPEHGKLCRELAIGGLPEGMLLFCDRFLAFDHHEKCTYICSVRADDNWAGRISQQLMACLTQAPEADSTPKVLESGIGWDEHFFDTGLVSCFTKDEYIQTIQKIKQYIKDGESYEVCLSNEYRLEANVDPFDLYTVLRTVNPAPFSAYVQSPEGAVLSSSPERFLRVDDKNNVRTEPIKGTRPRSRNTKADDELRQDLLDSQKDDAELLMITDLLRNDLARVSQPHSVIVEARKKITDYPSVFQLSSVINSKLRDGLDCFDLLNACFPGGSITGAPKKRTMEIISKLESRCRGIYTGSIGYIGYDGKMDMNIAIRTIVVSAGQLSFGSGGAIVADSCPEREFKEIQVKAFALLDAISNYLSSVHTNRG